jgi:hypothetical protein
MPGAETARAVLEDRETIRSRLYMSPALASKFYHMINSGQGCGHLWFSPMVLMPGLPRDRRLRLRLGVVAATNSVTKAYTDEDWDLDLNAEYRGWTI